MTKRILISLLFLALAVTSCNYAPDHTASPPTPHGPIPPTFFPTPTNTPESAPNYGGCAYMWASQDLPDVSKKVNDLLQAIDPNITASAYAFGENCVYADGHSTFGAMETDYRVKVDVKNIKDETALGNLIAKVMGVIIKIPLSDVQGPNLGRVEFTFVHSTEQVAVAVQINVYIHDAIALKGDELFKFFHKTP